MLAVYLFATIVGGVLLAASVVTGGHHGGGGHDVGHSGGHSSAASAAMALFSLRLWTYFLAFGGITGLVLSWLVGTSATLAAVLAAAVGVSSGALAHFVIRRMGTDQIGGTIGDSELVGRTGQLLLPVGKSLSGKVRLTVRNQAVDLIATSEEDLAAREEVLVVEVKEGFAVVARSPLAPRPTEQMAASLTNKTVK